MTKERRLGRGLAALLGEQDADASADGIGTSTAALEQAPPSVRNFAPAVQTSVLASPTAPPHSTPQPPEAAEEPRTPISERSAAEHSGSANQLLLLGVHDIDDNPFQPRREFSESEIVSLSESLKEHDMLQPVLVRRCGSRWQLISGERRLRAAIRAGWSQVPAQVREADDRLVAELAIVENLQRKDLNPIEKALSFRRYLDQHACTQEDLAKRLQIDRSTIANLLRLLELPEAVRGDLQSGAITQGHARALLPLGDEQEQLDFARRIQIEGLSVRDVERMVTEKLQQEDGDPAAGVGKPKKRPRTRSPHVASLEQRLRIALGTKVDIRPGNRGRGQLVIQFRGNDEFDRLMQLLLESAGDGVQSFAS